MGPGGEGQQGPPGAGGTEAYAPPGSEGEGWKYSENWKGFKSWWAPDGTQYILGSKGDKAHFPPGQNRAKPGWPEAGAQPTTPKSKLVKGTVYRDAQGKQARWNGKGFEPLNG